MSAGGFREARGLPRGSRRQPASGARQLWVIVHRWAGLTLALFLIVCALTGSLLAFYHDLHRATASWIEVRPPAPGAGLLDPYQLMEAVQTAAPEAQFNRLELDPAHGEALLYLPSPRSGEKLDYDEIAIDPYTGDEVYRGTWADLSEGRHQLMPFVFEVHYTLALGDWGRWLLGVAALVWTIDCFIGFYLSAPISRRRWWRNWLKAWRIRVAGSNRYKVNFDLHRAGGLWLWPILLVFAWSSVGLNLREVYTPVMGALGGTDVFSGLPDRRGPPDLQHDWPARVAQARALAAAIGGQQGFTIVTEDALTYRRASDTYEYRFRSSADLPTQRPQSRLFFDRESGAILAHKTGRGDLSANGLHEWIMALHIASIGGFPYRLFVVFLGFAITTLAVTGIVIWMRKRAARLLRGIPSGAARLARASIAQSHPHEQSRFP